MPKDVPPIQSDHGILDQFLPTAGEIADLKILQTFIHDKLTEQMDRWAIVGDIMFTGSTALETFTRGDLDIDIFVVVDVQTLEEFKHIFHQFAHLEWLQGQHIKHGHEPDREALTHRLTIWSGTVKHAQTKRYHLDLIILPRVGGLEQHTRFETVRHVEFFKNNLTAAQKQDVVRLKGLFKLGGIYGADQWSIKGVDCQTLIYRYKTLEGALHFLANLTSKSVLKDPSYGEAQIDRDLFATVFQSPLASIRLRQIREIARNYLEKRELPRSFEKEDWIAHQAKTHQVVFSLPPLGMDRAETFARAVSGTIHALNQLRGTISELRDMQTELDARLFGQTITISLKLHTIAPTIKRSLNKSNLVKTQQEAMIKAFKQSSKQRVRPPLITNVQMKETTETITIVFERNPVFAQFLVMRVIQAMLERRKLKIECWVEHPLDLKTIKPYFKINPRIKEAVLLNNLEKHQQLGRGGIEISRDLNHPLTMYYTLATYLLLPNLFGITQKTETQFQHYFSQEIDEIPKSTLLQIAALYHEMGTIPLQIDGKTKSPYRLPPSGESMILRRIGRGIGLTKNQMNYVVKLIEAATRLGFELEPLSQSHVRKAMIQEIPDLVLLMFADKVVLNRTTLYAQKYLVKRVLERFFESYEASDIVSTVDT